MSAPQRLECRANIKCDRAIPEDDGTYSCHNPKLPCAARFERIMACGKRPSERLCHDSNGRCGGTCFDRAGCSYDRAIIASRSVDSVHELDRRCGNCGNWTAPLGPDRCSAQAPCSAALPASTASSVLFGFYSGHACCKWTPESPGDDCFGHDGSAPVARSAPSSPRRDCRK